MKTQKNKLRALIAKTDRFALSCKRSVFVPLGAQVQAKAEKTGQSQVSVRAVRRQNYMLLRIQLFMVRLNRLKKK